MMHRFQISRRFRTFLDDQRGNQLVEFAILLPILLLLFAIIVEGGRLMWAYQATGAGVRDATRYLARVVPSDICDTGGSVAGWKDKVAGIVRNRQTGGTIFPTGIAVDTVTPRLFCVTGGYRNPTVPVARVTAELTVTFPMQSIFEFLGTTRPTIETVISDQSRVFGT